MRSDLKYVFKYDPKRGLCMKEVVPGREKKARFYAVSSYSDSMGRSIAEFLNKGFTDYENKRYEELATIMDKITKLKEKRK